MTIFEVKDADSQQGKVNKQYRGARYIEDAPGVKIEIIAEDDEASQVAHNIATVLRDGYLCDGEIAILPIEELIRVRVGQRSHSGRDWRDDIAPTNLMSNKTGLRSCLRTLKEKLL